MPRLRTSIAVSPLDRRAMERAFWQSMATDFGLAGLYVPETHGGSGASAVELAVAAEQLGASLAGGSFLSTAVFAVALLTPYPDIAAEYLPSVADGTLTISVITADDQPRGRLDVRSSASGWVINGRAEHVLAGVDTGLIFVAAVHDDGTWSLFSISADADGLSRDEMPSMDLTRPLASVQFRSTPARALLRHCPDVRTLERARAVALTMLAAEQTGGARRCLAMAVEFARNRVAFGRPIGAFQAIKHRCANMYMDVESAQAAAYQAAWALSVSSAGAELDAWAAAAHCGEAYTRAAKENIHIHGGIGCTWEHEAHLHLRRAWAGMHLLCTPHGTQEVIANRIGL
jgi:alkylation response protein AidB-like acyl-CoA dehydrogenase